MSALLAQTKEARSILPSAGLLSDLPLALEQQRALEVKLQTHDYVGAETLLLSAATAHPKDARFYSYLGRVFFLDHKYLNTVISFKKSEALQPLSETDRFTLAMAYIVIGHPDWARAEVDTLLQMSPHDPTYTYWQGRIAYDRQDLMSAEAAFRRTIALDPHSVKAYDNLGLCLEGMGQFDAAIEQYREAALLNRQQDTHSAWPALDLGSLLTKCGRLEEAQSALEEALAFDATSEIAHFQMGILLEKRNDSAAALRELAKAAELDPADPLPHFVLARVYRHDGDLQQSKRELKVFQGLQPRQPLPRLE